MILGMLVLAVFSAIYSMFATRMSSTVLTGPKFFIGFRFVLSVTGISPHSNIEYVLHIVAEVVLIRLLFPDAAQIDRKKSDFVLVLAINAVWISALLLRLTAQAGAKWYVTSISAMGDCTEMGPTRINAKPLIIRNT